MLHNPKCHARHIGPWLIETGYLNSALAAIKAGSMPTIDAAARGRELDSLPPYVIDTNGVAFIGIEGPMMKGDSKYGGSNTVRTRMAIRAAVADKAVKAVMLMIDSPGGSVAGTAELARDVAAADNVKPVYAHVDGMAASAALWVASQARKVFADPTAEVGSIGVVCVIEDSSAAAELAGVKVHVVSTGPFKGAFAEGTAVTEEHLAYLQERVNDQAKHFLSAIAEGRGMEIERVKALADGRMFSAQFAKKQGLIDGIHGQDESYQIVMNKVAPRRKAAEAALRDARLRALG